jgi:hypothetical protein
MMWKFNYINHMNYLEPFFLPYNTNNRVCSIPDTKTIRTVNKSTRNRIT